MKKQLISFGILMFAISQITFAQFNNHFDFTAQTGLVVTKSVEGYSEYEMNMGIPPLFLEAHLFPFRSVEFMQNIGIGLGFGFHHLRTEDPEIGWLWTYGGYYTSSLYYWPLFLSLKYNFPVHHKFIPYVKIDNGYNFFDAGEEIMWPNDRVADSYVWGGYYFGLSAGIVAFKWLTLELNHNRLNSNIGTDYMYSGYWMYWEENYNAGITSITFGVTF